MAKVSKMTQLMRRACGHAVLEDAVEDGRHRGSLTVVASQNPKNKAMNDLFRKLYGDATRGRVFTIDAGRE